MGNQSSVDLSCVVEKLSHTPGDTIKGCVFLKVNGSPLTHFDGVTVTLAGAEILVIGDSRVRGTIGKRIKLKQNISRFHQGVVPEGVHEFPFELELPDHEDDEEEDNSMTMHDSIDTSISQSSTGSLSSLSTVSKEIVYKLRASLRRKKNVPRTLDTDYWCDAKLADWETQWAGIVNFGVYPFVFVMLDM